MLDEASSGARRLVVCERTRRGPASELANDAHSASGRLLGTQVLCWLSTQRTTSNASAACSASSPAIFAQTRASSESRRPRDPAFIHFPSAVRESLP